MFNTLRQYFGNNYDNGLNSNEGYQYGEPWQQYRNHHVRNWLADMAVNQHQPMYEKNNRQHFWSRKKNRQQPPFFDPHGAPQFYQENGNYNNRQRLRNRSSHKSLSSLFHWHRDHEEEEDSSDDHFQQHQHQPFGNEPLPSSSKSHSPSYRRQRHNSLPSSGSLFHRHPQQQQQPFMTGAPPPMNHPAAALMNMAVPPILGNHLGLPGHGGGGGGVINPMLPQQQQPMYQQPMPMQGAMGRQPFNNPMMMGYQDQDQQQQHPPFNDRHHHQSSDGGNSLFGRQNSRSRQQQHHQSDHQSADSPYSKNGQGQHQPYNNNNNNNNSHLEQQQRQALNMYQSQMQQQQLYNYGLNNGGLYGANAMNNANYYLPVGNTNYR